MKISGYLFVFYFLLLSLRKSSSVSNLLTIGDDFNMVTITESLQTQINSLKEDAKYLELDVAALLEERALTNYKFDKLKRKSEEFGKRLTQCESNKLKILEIENQNLENSRQITKYIEEVDLGQKTSTEDNLSEIILRIDILENKQTEFEIVYAERLETVQQQHTKFAFAVQEMFDTMQNQNIEFTTQLENQQNRWASQMVFFNNYTLDLKETINSLNKVSSTVVSYEIINTTDLDLSLQDPSVNSTKDYSLPVEDDQDTNKGVILMDFDWFAMDLTSIKMKQWIYLTQLSLTNGIGGCEHTDAGRISDVLPDTENQTDVNYVNNPPNEVELIVVVDYEAYTTWYQREGGNPNSGRAIRTQQAITKYVTSLVHGMNSIYESLEKHDLRIKILLVDILIIQTNEGGHWLKMLSTKGFPRNIVKAGASLLAFYKWINKHLPLLPPHDHAMLLTGFDLQTANETPQRLTTGHAYLGTMCKRSSVSVVENQFNFEDVTAASHELAHSLGAEHDGDGNLCSAKDGYVMAPIIEVNATYRWSLSSCTYKYINNLIHILSREDRNCLYQRNNHGHMPIPVDADVQLGELLNPDQQCALIEGPGSFLCRDFYENNYHSLCRNMWCNNMTSPTPTCNTFLASDGFICGNKKICIKGECVLVHSAPVVSDHCPQGDEPGPVWNNYTCVEIIRHVPEQCYDGVTRMKCCASCASINTGSSECPYGDRSSWCRTKLELPIGCYNNEDLCCATCALVANRNKPFCPYGDRSKWCNATLTVPLGCYDNEDLCCETCSKFIDKTNPDCPYGDKSNWCAKSLELPYGCYKNSDLCCGMCAQHYKPQHIGCEYGDRSNWCVQEMKVPSECYLNQELCCGTCSQYYNSSHIGCEYGDKHSECSNITIPMGCYRNQNLCCGSCSGHRRVDRPGCEFGDKSNWCTNHLVPSEDCILNKELCCGTCIYSDPLVG